MESVEGGGYVGTMRGRIASVLRSIASIRVRFWSPASLEELPGVSPMVRSVDSTNWPSHIKTVRWISFCNWRTLPGQS